MSDTDTIQSDEFVQFEKGQATRRWAASAIRALFLKRKVQEHVELRQQETVDVQQYDEEGYRSLPIRLVPDKSFVYERRFGIIRACPTTNTRMKLLEQKGDDV